MTDTDMMPGQGLSQAMGQELDRRAGALVERREFFKAALGAAAVAGAGGAALTLGSAPASAQTALTDIDYLNFALNLEYLEAQFYSYAVFGVGIPSGDTTGTGTAGAATGGRQVTFTDPVVAQCAREIAFDELGHVRGLRLVLGASAVAQPALDIGVTATSSFSAMARAVGLVGTGASFDVYANDDNFLLGAFYLADIMVSAYKAATAQLSSASLIDAATAYMAAEANQAGLIRSLLFTKGAATASLRTSADSLSGARDTFDGTGDTDQGISPTGTTPAANITPLDSNGITYSRDTGKVLNTLYLTSAAATSGGFFPAGMNGTITTSAASA